MSIAEKIEALLRDRIGHPMSVEELAGAIPSVTRADILEVCTQLRAQRRLGRNGANSPASPYRFYLKMRGALPPLRR